MIFLEFEDLDFNFMLKKFNILEKQFLCICNSLSGKMFKSSDFIKVLGDDFSTFKINSDVFDKIIPRQELKFKDELLLTVFSNLPIPTKTKRESYDRFKFFIDVCDMLNSNIFIRSVVGEFLQRKYHFEDHPFFSKKEHKSFKIDFISKLSFSTLFFQIGEWDFNGDFAEFYFPEYKYLDLNIFKEDSTFGNNANIMKETNPVELELEKVKSENKEVQELENNNAEVCVPKEIEKNLINDTSDVAKEEVQKISELKKQLADKQAKFYIINANKIAHEIGMGRRTNTILQSAFFALNPQILPIDKAVEYMKEMAKKSYSKKGDAIVQLNYKAMDAGKDAIEEVTVDPKWADLEIQETKKLTGDDHFDNFVSVINALDGNDLPVSAFMDKLDGSMKSGMAYMEKRGIATMVPQWNKDDCIQCNNCVMVCPHATIRAFLMTDEEIANAPEDISNDVLKPMGKGVDGLSYRIQVSPDNCVGCGLCVEQCLGNKKGEALKMVNVHEELEHAPLADYIYKEVEYRDDKYPTTTVKGVGFKRPYFEVSGACPGCGETPYYRLATQLFGSDMMIANATGCSSIYSGSTPSTPFTTDKNGQGPAWCNSLFEDNAEFGYGMKLAQNYNEAHMIQVMENAKDACEPELKETIEKYLSVKGQRSEEKAIVPELLKLVEASSNDAIKEVLDNKGNLVSKSQWIVGGDGWAYDIGYGGLDHVIANNENVNILVLDTEVYSNTGGQSSKSSQAGSIAKFTAGGKTGAKKDLAQIAMAYGHVYVAQIAMGANPAQTIKAMKEAESYDGPSLIIAYAPCQAHGIKGGLANHQAEQKRAIDCGYFNLLRYDPRLEEQGKNPLQLDSKTPNFDGFKDYLLGENRFSQLLKVNPEHAEQLMAKCQADAQKRRARLEKMAQ